MDKDLKLLGRYGSPFVCRAQIALELKGVKYEYMELHLYRNKDPLINKYNPVHNKVTVLLHNGNPISESLLIVKYIDETWNGVPILPPYPYRRSVERFWAKFIDEKCFPAIWKATWTKDELQKEATEEAHALLKTLENELNGNKFFRGGIGLVDIAGAFIGFWLGIIQEAGGFDLPCLYEWTLEIVNCGTIKKVLPCKDTLLRFFQSRLHAGTYLVARY